MRKFNLVTSIIKFKEKIFKSFENKLNMQAWTLGIFILGATAFLVQFHSQGEPKTLSKEASASIDTFIPEGESLVPIQVSNYESLDQVIGQYGVVDLLSTPLNPNEKAKRIAYAVKLIRSPKSPRHFSVLVPADKSHKLAGHHGEFTVVVRNPALLGTKFVNKKRTPVKRRVFYETEEI